jgi:hypothetical protein
MWTFCGYNQLGDRECLPAGGHGYTVPLENIDGDLKFIGVSWTRGLVAHVVGKPILLSSPLASSSAPIRIL